MANWFKGLFSRRTEINNQTIHADLVQQADTINNSKNTIINIPKKLLLPIALLLVALTVVLVEFRGQNQVNNLTIYYLGTAEAKEKQGKQLENQSEQIKVMFNRFVQEEKQENQIKILNAMIGEALVWKLLTKDNSDIAMEALKQRDVLPARQLFIDAAKNAEDLALKYNKQAAANYRNYAASVDISNPKEGLEVFLHAVKLDPENAEGWTQLGDSYKRNKNFKLAENAYKKANALTLKDNPVNLSHIRLYAENLSARVKSTANKVPFKSFSKIFKSISKYLEKISKYLGEIFSGLAAIGGGGYYMKKRIK